VVFGTSNKGAAKIRAKRDPVWILSASSIAEIFHRTVGPGYSFDVFWISQPEDFEKLPNG
jgi:hypothetical protein